MFVNKSWIICITIFRRVKVIFNHLAENCCGLLEKIFIFLAVYLVDSSYFYTAFCSFQCLCLKGKEEGIQFVHPSHSTGRVSTEDLFPLLKSHPLKAVPLEIPPNVKSGDETVLYQNNLQKLVVPSVSKGKDAGQEKPRGSI